MLSLEDGCQFIEITLVKHHTVLLVGLYQLLRSLLVLVTHLGKVKLKIGEDKLENLIKAINQLKAKVGIKESFKDYGIDEADFLSRLDDMVEKASDDQCTGANPRYLLMSEIK